jgi:N-acetylglucosaminyl-diphospho-decaprenol L-rhamnosyltransferase
MCIQDLLNQSKSPFEIILVDNGSSTDTIKFFSKHDELIIIRNEINKGCAYSWNQGIRESKGEWIIILNNDVRLPEQWLENLISYARMKELDVVSPGMREGVLDYNFRDYSHKYTKLMHGAFRKWTPSGVCFALHRKVIDKIGYFDENYKIGQYEDADFFRRCKIAKLKMGITGASFIHHFGSSTQKYLKEKGATGYALENRNYHRKKWKLGFFQRNFERYREQLLTKFWSYKERFKYGHSLIEKSDGLKISYF